jgi:APA family basic amino acid/polyamine antiporter
LNLQREVGLFGAMMMGLGSIIGTGVFVSIGLGVNIAGSGVLVAIFLASIVAVCNGLSSAQLAANHPVSGGTYEYGHRWLSPQLGFIAGWMFLCAKSASAAAAALGLASYLLQAADISSSWSSDVGTALGAIVGLSLITLLGIRRSNIANTIVVAITLSALAFFIVVGLATPGLSTIKNSAFLELESSSIPDLLQVTALMFVAYTGYGRIATLGEEIKNPRRNIPRAVIMTLIVSMLIYLGVGWVIVKFTSLGAAANVTSSVASPAEFISLKTVALQFNVPGASEILFVGAVTSMLGVLLNLLLGLSRVMLAMGRRGEMPAATAVVSESTSTPTIATLAVTAIICMIAAIGSVKVAWSFSAFTVLIYYSITNLCALRLTQDERLYSVLPSWVGLFACLFLAFWVAPQIWLVGLGLIAVGLIWQAAFLFANRK